MDQEENKEDGPKKKFQFKKVEDEHVANILNQFFEEQKE